MRKAALRLVEPEGQREGEGVENTVGVDRNHPIGDGVQIADILARDVVGRLPFLAIAGLIDTEDKGTACERVTGQPKPNGAQVVH